MKIKITGDVLAASAWGWGWGVSGKIRRKKRKNVLRRGIIDVPGDKPLRTEEKSNNNGVASGVRTQATLVGIECTQHCTNLVPSLQTATSFPQRGFTEGY